ncbi:MAG: sugar transferase [Beijerinckiaceae bacterium]
MRRTVKFFFQSGFLRTIVFLFIGIYLADIYLFERSVFADREFLLSIILFTAASYVFVLNIKPNNAPVFTVILIQAVLSIAYVLYVAIARKKFPTLLYAGIFLFLLLALTVERIRAQKFDHLSVAITNNVKVDELANIMGMADFKVIGSDLTSDRPDLIIADLDDHSPEWNRFYLHARSSRLELMHWTEFVERRKGRITPSDYGAITIAQSDMQRFYIDIKRYSDIAFVLLAAPLALPFLLAGMLVVYLSDGRPIFFTQNRVGYLARRFRIYKLRTMKQVEAGPHATAADDARIRPAMRILRRTRIDELPQLWNILKGDMTLIGPRPESVALSEIYDRNIPGYELRHMLRPGITGWAQVKQGSTASMDEAMSKYGYDMFYIKYLSLDLDIRILFKTLITLVTGRGAR